MPPHRCAISTAHFADDTRTAAGAGSRCACLAARHQPEDGGSHLSLDGESAAIYHEQQREELAAEEEAQARVLEDYLPKRVSEEELEATVRGIITASGAAGMKDMGRTMAEANKRLAGQADGSAIAALVKRLLSGG